MKVRVLYIVFVQFFLINCFTGNIYSQDKPFVLLPKKYGVKKWKPVLGFDAHRSFYSGKPVKINGLKFGVEYKGVHRFGFGFYGLKHDVYFAGIPVDDPHATDTSLVRFSLNYAALFYERVILKARRWEVVLPIHLGAGGLEGYVQDANGIFHKYTATSFSLVNFGLGAKFFVLPWLAPKVGIGYRFTFNTDKSLRKSFNAPFYSFGVSINVGELYRIIFN